MPNEIDHAAAAKTQYDVLVVGSGVSGAVIARSLAERDLRVLVVEAGPGDELSSAEYGTHLTRFYGAAAKDNNSAYEVNPNAPMPRSPDVRRLQAGAPDSTSYLVQNGPVRDGQHLHPGARRHHHALGGQGACACSPRTSRCARRFGQGRDWPIGYDDLEPDYRQAERELGVSADVADQSFYGITFPPGYEFPMHGLPQSYLDKLRGA